MSTLTADAQPRAMSLRVHVATLLIILLLLVGGALGWLGYRSSGAILWSAIDRLTDQIGANVELSIRATYGPATSAVDLLSQSGLGAATTLEQRLAYVPLLGRALEGSPELAAVYAGYDDGDFFILRRLDADGVRAHVGASETAAFAIDAIEDVGGERRGTRILLDPALVEMARAPLADARFDPRARPWYAAGTAAPGRALTEPYRFALSGRTGVTISRRFGAGGGVLGADVTLHTLSTTLAASALGDSARLVLLDDAGRVLAYSAPSEIADDASDVLPLPAQTGVDLLVMAATHIEPGQRATSAFDALDRRWITRQHQLATRGAAPWHIALIAPEDELLADATRMLRRAALVTLALVAVLVPVAWLMAGVIARPLAQLARETRLIRRFDFSTPIDTHSGIREIGDLAESMNAMKATIDRFLDLIGSLSRESAYERLLDRVLDETMRIGAATGGAVFLLDDDGAILEPASARIVRGGEATRVELGSIRLAGASEAIVSAVAEHRTGTSSRARRTAEPDPLGAIYDALGADTLELLAVPLADRRDQTMGVLCLLGAPREADAASEAERVAFVGALSGFAAVSLETQRLLVMEKELLDAFIRLIAGAIDAKSPYTGGHCQRVPELTLMLARAACASDEPAFREFDLDEEQWEELRIASWLHDCGKVTTPEYVVDKATKLETLYDRIHEVRMRFEVLKQDAEIAHLRRLLDGHDAAASAARLAEEHATLDAEFTFVAECNEGGEFMAPERIERLDAIAKRTWRRTLDDRIGISWDERARKARTPAPTLPIAEPLLADRPEHLVSHDAAALAADLGAREFRIEVPEHAYNRGERYNLAIARGTLSAEERFKINDHIVQTIVMLEKLPLPKRLRRVPEIAGGHHEKMDGTGYPRRLVRDDMPLAARMMAIADIFEALTASDRPYKKAKTLSEAVRIMGFMRKDAHVDADLFELFLTSGVYREYAEAFLDASQIDVVDVAAYVDSR